MYAIVTMLILIFSEVNNSLQQDSNVAPVVITSSINKMCLLVNFDLSGTLNFVLLLLNLSKRCLRVCVFVADVLIKTPVMYGFFNCFDKLKPKVVSWLYPRCFCFFGCRGTGIIQSIVLNSLEFARICPNQSPIKVPISWFPLYFKWWIKSFVFPSFL